MITSIIIIIIIIIIITHLVLLLEHFAGVWALVGHVDALEAVDVLGEAGLGDVGLPGLDGLHQGVVDEAVLLLSLHEAVTLLSVKYEALN